MSNLQFAYWFSLSPVVQGVLLILLIASILSWTLIFQRGFALGRSTRLARSFEKKFWKEKDLGGFYQKVSEKKSREGLAAIFVAGYEAFINDGWGERVIRAMRVAASYEEENLDEGLSFLATVGSVSPYIGLFGTVWGIMTAFHALGDASQVTIAMIAPGISEALVATALGLFAAIPAVIFYNRFSTKADRLFNKFDAFQEELAHLLGTQS